MTMYERGKKIHMREEISFEEFGYLLDEVADKLPREIFINLNGGISLVHDAPPHPESATGNDLLILGHYHAGGSLGRYINIYYGSFIRLYGGCSRDILKQQIDRVLRHEFLHHLESMAGEKDLEIQDAIDLERYKAGIGKYTQ